ncbi:MAG: PEGA domain-containing protein, partial [Myxococcaceae bacterium]|nr:PEGA domain-containing protein [Myxococcaceae bacterium]
VVIGGALAVLAAGILVAVAWPHADPTPAVVEIPPPPPVPAPSVAPPTPPAPADPPPVKPGPTAETVAAHDPPATPTPPVKPQGTGKVVPQVKPVANTGPATVVVTATHEGKLSWAWLDVDGMRQGATPKRLTLEPGPHTLQLSRDGFRTVTRSVSVAAGEDKKLSVPMEAQ